MCHLVLVVLILFSVEKGLERQPTNDRNHRQSLNVYATTHTHTQTQGERTHHQIK